MKSRKVLSVVVLAGVLALAPVAAANAAVVSAGGGTWNFGTNLGNVYSHYHHDSRCHGSIAVGWETVRSANTAAGQWSYANARQRVGIVDNAYWRHC